MLDDAREEVRSASPGAVSTGFEKKVILFLVDADSCWRVIAAGGP